eukprot:284573_1
MCTLLRHVLMDEQVIDEYTEDLLKHILKSQNIKLRFIELMNQYKWMNDIFTNGMTVNVANIHKLLYNPPQITFIMPKHHKLSHEQCKSFIEDLNIISNKNNKTIINFQWPEKISTENKSIMNIYQNELQQIKWSLSFSVDVISCSYINNQTLPQSTEDYLTDMLVGVKLRNADLLVSSYSTNRSSLFYFQHFSPKQELIFPRKENGKTFEGMNTIIAKYY